MADKVAGGTSENQPDEVAQIGHDLTISARMPFLPYVVDMDSNAEQYLKAKQEWIAASHRPDPVIVFDVNGQPLVDEDQQIAGVRLGVDVDRYPRARPVFEVAAQGSGWTVGKFRWHEALIPPTEIYDVQNPIYLRLDLSFTVPNAAEMSFLLSLLSRDDLLAASAIAETGMVELVACGDASLDGTPLPIKVPWPTLEGLLLQAVRSGYIASE